MLDPHALRRRADATTWFHSIDLGAGVVTRGSSTTQMPDELFPAVAGRSVLDIGAWDGYYSFMAERRGAREVVALDHYVWGVDFGARDAYWNECFATGTLPDQARDLTDFWRPDLPGRRGIELAVEALDSLVQPRLADFATTDIDALGIFDVVLYLGVLYHMKEPLTCLERVRAVTNEVAVIETQALHVQGLEHERVLQFYAGGEVNNDFGNWYVPTESALHSLCRAAGFSSVETVLGPPAAPPVATPSARSRVLSRLGRRDAGGNPSPGSEFYRLMVHAYV
jgi:tRNA (mo5U34)-methyltransferase